MANDEFIEGEIYDWLMANRHTSEERAEKLSSLMQRSGTHVPRYMRRDDKLVNFFLDRPNLFGVVDYDVESRNVQYPGIYAIDFRQEYRGRPPARGRGGIRTYSSRKNAQAAADARLSRFQEYFADSNASEQREIDRNTPGNPSYNWSELIGGKYSKKSKSKSRSRSARKSRSRKNKNRRSKSKSRN
jgi:hypothetical protein